MDDGRCAVRGGRWDGGPRVVRKGGGVPTMRNGHSGSPRAAAAATVRSRGTGGRRLPLPTDAGLIRRMPGIGRADSAADASPDGGFPPPGLFFAAPEREKSTGLQNEKARVSSRKSTGLRRKDRGSPNWRPVLFGSETRGLPPGDPWTLPRRPVLFHFGDPCFFCRSPLFFAGDPRSVILETRGLSLGRPLFFAGDPRSVILETRGLFRRIPRSG